MPNMGIAKSKPRTGLADALFSVSQQRVLARFFGQPGRSYYANELISATGGGSGAIQRELAKLERSGLIIAERRGAQKHYKANPASPLYEELCGIVRKTVGLVEPLREALQPYAGKIKAAFVYGSVAKRQDTVSSDVDLMIISDDLDFATLVKPIMSVEEILGRAVNPNLFKTDEFARRRREPDSFIARVMQLPKLWIVGDEPDFPA
ncbi:MAG: transcriptional regulator [Steroidobacteraceae bacterium]